MTETTRSTTNPVSSAPDDPPPHPPPTSGQQQQPQSRQVKQQQTPDSTPASTVCNVSLLESDESMLSELSSSSSSESELSSVGSMSPPPGYMSPASSHPPSDSGLEPSKTKKSKKRAQQQREGGDDEQTTSKDGEEPTRKKRKTPEPKPRTRRDLDVRIAQNIPEQSDELAALLTVLRKRRKIVVVAGAGISVSAGIPDFRSSTGLFKSLKSEHKLKGSGKALFDASVYSTDSSTSSFHDMVRNMSSLVSSAKPTPFHRMLQRLGDEGRLMRLYTQNVDGIDTALPSLATTVPLPPKGPWPRAVQLHGGLEKMVCTKCHALSSFEPELFDGPAPPPCQVCVEADRVRTSHAGKRSHGVGRLRPRMVLYNEHNPDEEAIGSCVAADLRARPDAIIVVGTSMKIPGVRRIVREMCGVVRGRRDGVTIWMNHDDPPPGKDFEDIWDLVIKGPCDEVARQWDIADLPGEECSSSDIEGAKQRTGEIRVVVPSSPKKAKSSAEVTAAAAAQLVTPDSTPKQRTVEPVRVVPKVMLKLKPPRAAQQEQETVPPQQPQKKKTATKKATQAQLATAKKVANKTTAGKKASKTVDKPASLGKSVGANKSTTAAATATSASSTKKTAKPKASSGPAIKAVPSVGPVAGGIQSHFAVAKAGVKKGAKAKKTGDGKEAKQVKEPLSPAGSKVNAAARTAMVAATTAAAATQGEQKVHRIDIKSDNAPQTPLRVEIPEKPAEGESRRSSIDTISPTSIPRGMGDLLT